eukprot:548829-Pleurochrysis_carterae.AAC.1
MRFALRRSADSRRVATVELELARRSAGRPSRCEEGALRRMRRPAHFLESSRSCSHSHCASQ